MHALLLTRGKTFSYLLPGLVRRSVTLDRTEGVHTAIENLSYGSADILVAGLIPHGRNLEAIRALRLRNIGLPIIACSEEHAVKRRIELLRAGADAVLGVPVEIEELLATMEAVVLRANGYASACAQRGPFKYDSFQHTLFFQNQKIELTRNESSVVEALFLGNGRILDRRRLLHKLYATHTDVQERIIDSLVKHVRRKLRDANAPDFIQTRTGLGYCLSPELVQTNLAVAAAAE